MPATINEQLAMLICQQPECASAKIAVWPVSGDHARQLHAVALDERRDPFKPTLWEPRENVLQALFPGGHCDIGGGYPDRGLSDRPLRWAVDKLKEADVGLIFTNKEPVTISHDPLAPRH
ncbi:T6SS phospholipase effector Tle1-like catalytic domain-containing protein [Burkholderia pseudomallei]|uniref:phospholipase effector Tle1 domain-containing protein n=1 Tax=Burkholderia pseudomallei TaxID=28450 RepID=UPI0010A8BD79|nr:DUF2235 domain-containing protein [Burkholderia pseudomallei]MBF3932670.1 DUF2235 domain-containing protein [Burkholderia pseudomallei]